MPNYIYAKYDIHEAHLEVFVSEHGDALEDRYDYCESISATAHLMSAMQAFGHTYIESSDIIELIDKYGKETIQKYLDRA